MTRPQDDANRAWCESWQQCPHEWEPRYISGDPIYAHVRITNDVIERGGIIGYEAIPSGHYCRLCGEEDARGRELNSTTNRNG